MKETEPKLSKKAMLGGAAVVLFMAGAQLRGTADGERIQELENKVATLQADLHLNDIGDCVTEGILRNELGKDILDLAACRQERKNWQKQVEPEGTPKP